MGDRWMNEYGKLGEKLYTCRNDIDRGKLNFTGRKTLYSLGGRWMNEYGAMVE